jgi:group II intron reverse transcriptase/maturase
MLGEAFARLRKGAAAGIDGVRHAEYAENLGENLARLEERLKHGRYRARSVRRRWIPKPGGRKLRPLGIPVVEDKIVQQAVAMILGAIWEEDFADESIGYRPGRDAREAVLALRGELNGGSFRWVVEADIRGYFENIDHGWLVRMLEQRIADRGMVRLITKWLKAGILEEDGRTVNPETGTPQGGVISPVLANIYLHYVQDLWIRRVVAKRSKGRVIFRRYADDSVVCFEREDDARWYLRELRGRLAKFNLEIAGEKSAMVKFNRWEPEASGKFTFLGFDFYWGRTRRNRKHVVVKMRTNLKKFRASLLALKEWLKLARSQRLPELLETLRRKLQGHFNYYAVVGNSKMTASYLYNATRLLYKWLNRRSQRKSFGWKAFNERLPAWRLPSPRIRPANPQMKLQWQEKHA